MEDQDDSETTVVGRRPRTNPRTRIIAVIVVSAVIVFAIVGQRWFLLSLYVALAITQFGIALRPTTVVSATGIQRPWRRRSFISWGQVSSVSRPVPGKLSPRLNLLDGKSIALDDIPADKTAMIAELGGKEISLPAPAKLPPPARPSERPRSDQEIEADVERRANALREERRRLAGGS